MCWFFWSGGFRGWWSELDWVGRGEQEDETGEEICGTSLVAVLAKILVRVRY
ncbi:hypothetical protein KH172YL63_03230 [Bacillus sp. KH172YL63]|nr:hypothetical protein KH172YL63_03230 [Bacillus sp. KH172YL63]